jgi:anti-sigma B factor antagonist
MVQVEVSKRNQVTIIAVAGSIDALSAEDVREHYISLLDQGEKRLVADLSQVDFMSSAGLRVILDVSKRARQAGGDLRLAGASTSVEKMLKISGFMSILKCFPSADNAVASFEN